MIKKSKEMEDLVIPAKVVQLLADYYPSVYEMITDFVDTYTPKEEKF